MKEIARVEILDKTCDDCRFELAGCDRRYPNKIECNMLNDRKNWKVEQFPETWEELKSLCKNLKDIQIIGNVIYLEPEDLARIELYSDGVIVCNEYVLAGNRTPAQMWAIIKNLTGEE